jgi:hypothetical protein
MWTVGNECDTDYDNSKTIPTLSRALLRLRYASSCEMVGEVEIPMRRNSMIGFGVIRVSGWVRGREWGVHACWTDGWHFEYY